MANAGRQRHERRVYHVAPLPLPLSRRADRQDPKRDLRTSTSTQPRRADMNTKVLIAGAGPTGLTLAIDLARRGVEVRIVDRAAEFFAGSRGDELQPRTLEALVPTSLIRDLSRQPRPDSAASDGIGLPTASMLQIGRDEVYTLTAENPADEQPVGRRERKLQQTRSELTRAALDLFSERGFDAVTVVDIADRADLDPSTFFRHFRSKESLLFTDMDNYVAVIRPFLNERPVDEPLIESLRAASLRVGDSYDYELENLRAELTESSAELRAQVVIHREGVATDLAELIGERLRINTKTDPRPYLAAVVWVAAFDWFRHRKVSTHKRVKSATSAINEIAEMAQSAPGVLLLSPKSATGRRRKT
jgi:AcrR family transcriptional regulator